MSDVSRAIRHTIRHSQKRKKFADGGVPDIGDPLIPDGGQFSAGTRFGNKAADIGSKLAAGVAQGLLSLPRRAIENSQRSLDTGTYDPAVPIEAALLTMGAGAGGRGGYRPVNPARAEVDHPPQLTYKPNDQGAIDAGPTERTAAPAGDVGQGVGDTPGGGSGLREAQLSAQRRASGRASVEGLPTEEQLIDGQFYVPGPFGRAHDVAEQYMAGRDTPTYHRPPEKYHEIDKEHSAAIARAYEEMAHTPNDPATMASYEALIKETMAQYQAIKASGLKITPVSGADYPYGKNPRAVARDVADNNHMAFFKTDEGFGTGDAIHADNPMLRSSGEKIGDHDMLNNDIFRVVHDYFGHIKNGYGFRATGEDNAWRAHAAMYSDLARPAMTTETRGQNSWVNYGPHGEKNRTASGADTVYADQKVGLMPEWTMRDRGSPEPIIAYHGSPYSFDKFDPAKIGAGEGNQAYGHGLYFAEHSPVSEFYRYQLASRRDPLLQKYGLDAEQGAHLGIQLASSKGDPAPVIASLQEGLDKLLAERAAGRTDKATQNMIKAREGKIAYLQDPERATGHLYQVAIDHPPEKFINWEDQLSRQTPEVQEGVKKAMGLDYYNKHDQAKADRIWEAFKDANASNALRQGFIASSDELVARRLRDSGIPGIRYLDQNSRGVGRGTSNYVTFDAPRLLRRYAEGGEVLPDVGRPLIGGGGEFSSGTRVGNRLVGAGGEPRYQLWPEKMVRSGASLAGDILSGNQKVLPPGVRREDYTDIPPPSAPTEDSTWLGRKLGIAPVGAQPNDEMMERAQDMAGLAGGQALLTGAKEAAPVASRALVAAADSQAAGAPLAALEHAPKFYSGAERTVEAAPQPKMTGAQWIGTLANRGVKAEEMQWTGLGDFLLAKKDAPVTKAEVQEHLGANRLEMGEVEKAGQKQSDRDVREYHDVSERLWNEMSEHDRNELRNLARENTYDADSHTKFQEYQLPGGENYREKLLTLSGQETAAFAVRKNDNGTFSSYDATGKYGSSGGTFGTEAEAMADAARRNLEKRFDQSNYRSSHWDEPNVLVHRRSNERDVNGQRSLHIEEIQSDWHQQGRKSGYNIPAKKQDFKIEPQSDGSLIVRGEDGRPFFHGSDQARAEQALQRLRESDNPALQTQGVPDAPFKKNWHELALKDAIREAAEKGLDRISWTPGEAQAARYDLSRVADKISYAKSQDGTYSISVRKGKDELLQKSGLSEKQLEETIGKEPTKKIVDNVGRDVGEPAGAGTLQGLNLKVGGEGMKGFYDKIIPDALNKIGKPHGVKVEQGHVVKPETKLSYEEMQRRRAGVNPPPSHFQQPVHYMDIPQSLKDQALKKGFSLFEDSSMTGAPLAALEQQRVPMPGGLRKPKPYFEGELRDVNAGVDARPNKAIQTVADPHRMMFPGIYRNPRMIAEEAASRVGAEDPAMKQLFGVTRGDLREMAQGRVGNEEPNLALARNPRGSLAAQNIQTPHNTQRLVDTLAEAGKHEGLRTADAWYIMDPLYQRMKGMFGPEEAATRFRHLNTTTGMASPGSDVMTEIQRGTGAHWLQQQGRFDDFVKYAGLTGPARQSPRVPADIRYIGGHPYHTTSQTAPMQKYFDTGSIQTEKAKVPLYVHASGVPETGFQTSGPVGDAHFSRGVGLADTRRGPTDVGSSFSKPEYQTLQPWWKDEVAGAAGLESVPAQARLWTALGPQTGVASDLGAPKLELFAKQIMKTARRLNISPEKARDFVLSGRAGAGKRGGAVGPNFAPGGRVGYKDAGEVPMDDDVPTFDPAKLAALRAPAFDPAKLAAVKKKEPGPMSAMDVASGAVENAPASAWQFAQDIVRPITHPMETLGGLKDLGLGLLEKSGAVGTILPPTGGGHEQYADAMGQYLKNRYGGLENIKRSIAKDPVGVLSDASMVLTGGGSAAARLPGALGRAGEIAGTVGRAVDPLLAPVNAAKVGTKAVGELMTHTGATPLENAYRAGVEGGEAGDVFRGQMRGTSDMVEPVTMAKAGLEGYRAARSRNYRSARDDITSLDRQMAPQDRILDFGKIDDAVDQARKVQTFGTRVLDKGANEVRNAMIREIEEWKALDPVEYHTIDGLDALKRSLGHMMMDTQPGTSARKAAGDIYNAVKKTIVEYDPKYATVMRDYEQASTQIRELERAMSLGEKASADTALRKLQSIMRNNVNTNYGRRLELGQLLEENGATHLMAALSGQALNAWAPRGLGKLGAELGVLAGAGHFISPWTLAATPLMSPRLMGEVSHAVGRTFGRGLNATNRALSGVGGNRTAGNISYRMGRTTNPDENAPNPYAP